MFRIALQSAAQHRSSFLATGVVVLTGAALVSAMAGVLATGVAPATATEDRAFLTQFPAIMGGWILAIVLFAVVSTVSIALDSRRNEVTGLRLVGATPPQVQRMVAIEAAAVSVVAAVPGAALGYPMGWTLLTLVRSSGLIDAGSSYGPGVVAPATGALLLVAAAVVGGYWGSRAGARRSPVPSPAEDADRSGRRRLRLGAASALAIAGIGSSSAALAMDRDSVYATAATGPGCVLVAVGLAVLAPELLRLGNLLVRLLPERGSGPGRLARTNLRESSERVRPVVTFLTLFVGVAAGTLTMQGIENTVASGTDSLATVLASINYVVVALIAVFMAIALTSTVVSAVGSRVPEFATMSLVGATASQVRRMVATETALACLVSVVAGSVGALVAVLPFAAVKTGSPTAALAPVPYLVTLTLGTAVTLGVTALACRRATAAGPQGIPVRA